MAIRPHADADLGDVRGDGVKSVRANIQAQSDIDFFFDDPTMEPILHRRSDGTISILYLLRREAQETFFGRIRPETLLDQQTQRHRGFATSLVLMAGVDLMGKFATGSDAKRGVKFRFVHFAERHMGLTTLGAQGLYKVRNCLMHSFGLFDPDTQNRVTIEVHDQWPAPGATPVDHCASSGRTVMQIEATFQAFLNGIASYEADVRSGLSATDFAAMFQKYGRTYYGSG